MRVFAAIPLPDDVVADLRDHLPTPSADVLRWTDPASWHLTLAFFGSMPDAGIDDLRRRLRRTARRHPGLALGLAGSGHFTRRVVWAGVTGDLDPLGRLARSVTAAGRRAGADIDDDSRYRPHLTLARTPSPRPGDGDPVRATAAAAVAATVDALRDYAGPSWTAPAFTLVRSELGQGKGGRARHTTLETFALTGRAPGTGRSRSRAPRGPAAPTGRR